MTRFRGLGLDKTHDPSRFGAVTFSPARGNNGTLAQPFFRFCLCGKIRTEEEEEGEPIFCPLDKRIACDKFPSDPALEGIGAGQHAWTVCLISGRGGNFDNFIWLHLNGYRTELSKISKIATTTTIVHASRRGSGYYPKSCPCPTFRSLYRLTS